MKPATALIQAASLVLRSIGARQSAATRNLYPVCHPEKETSFDAGRRSLLILLARPVAVFACLLPFGFTLRETAFASWVGLRGAVPIYLRIIPALADPRRDQRLFASIFILVIASLVVQGWTVGPRARLVAA